MKAQKKEDRNRTRGSEQREKSPRVELCLETKRFLLVFLFFFFFLHFSFGLDFSISPGGFIFLSSGEGSKNADGSSRYKTGGGGNAGLDFDLASVLPNPLGLGYTIGAEAAMLFSPSAQEGSQLTFYSLGGTLGLYYFPLSRLPLRIDSCIGIYTASDDDNQTPSNLYFRIGGETGFRFTPGFTLTAGGGWRRYNTAGTALNSGFYAGLGARMSFELGSRSSGGTAASLEQDGAVYPVLMPLYQQFPIGEIIVRNNENAEIRNVRVSFRAAGYTSSEYPCGQASQISKGRSRGFPLYADFSSEILRFADSGRILGEIIIRYSFLGKEREAVRTISIAVNNANTIVPGDNSALAAFVSAANPDVLQFSKYSSALARSSRRMGLNANMETSIWIFEAIRASVRLRDSTAGNEVQFPNQTLAYGSGSALDIALLYAASLQAAGISAALIKMPSGEILAAAALGLSRDDAATAALFNGPSRLLIVGDEVLLPAAMSMMEEGFTAAWNEAIRQIDSLLEGSESARQAAAKMIFIEDAWQTYPPAPFPSLGIRLTMPDSITVNTAANIVIQHYINAEFAPKAAELQAQIRAGPTAQLFNQLGNVYLRSGYIPQAKTAYEQAAGMGSTGAMVNRGNIALNEGDLTAAERWFRRALAGEPQNRGALRGIEQVDARR